jgi:hypothetical protein
LAVVVVLCLCLPSATATPQALTNAFTYQGRLQDGVAPGSGVFDFEFALFPAASGGTQAGPTVTANDVSVSAGLFAVSLDFGGGVFTGARRWLEVRVRPGDSTGTYIPLSPRQELTAAPNALFAAGAHWTGITGKPSGFGDDVDNDSGGDITAVTAGTGLTGGGTVGDVALAVSFGNSGVAGTAARSDHDHFGQIWTGFSGSGLAVNNLSGHGLSATSGAVGARGIFGSASGTTGFSDGVFGHTASAQGRGTVGYATEPTGANYGVWGQSDSTAGRGVYGLATATSGVNYGVYGETASPAGFAGYFQGPVRVNGPIWFGANTALRVAQSAYSIFGFAHEGPQIVMGYEGNSVVGIGTVAGGGQTINGAPWPNRVVQHGGTVGGGIGNRAGSMSGDPELSNAFYATVAGGTSNTARGPNAFVGGGDSNTASGAWTAVPGGQFNVAGPGSWSFAAGSRAKATHSGTFVWSDGQGSDFASTASNQFLIRAAGGVGVNTNAPGGFALAVNGDAAKTGGGGWAVFSDARMKRDIEPLRGTLDRLLALRGVSFEYRDPEGIHERPGRRIGMIAQEVEAVFPDWVGRAREGYLYLTYRGFEALTVEALRDLREEKDREIARIQREKDVAVAQLRADVEALKQTVGALQSALAAERYSRVRP